MLFYLNHLIYVGWVGDLLKHPYLFLREQGGHLGKDFIKSSANVQKRSSPILITVNHIIQFTP